MEDVSNSWLTDWFLIEQLEDGVWALHEPHVEEPVSYLLTGHSQALLVDTGLGVGDIREVVERLTSLPVIVVNTHSHYDHIGGNRQFEDIAVHAAEAGDLESGVPADQLRGVAAPEAFLRPPPPSFDPQRFSIPPSRVTRVLDDHDVLDLGGRRLEVIHTPGHSPGSICLWELERGILLVGDVLYRGTLFAQLPGHDFAAYHRSLERLSLLVHGVRLLLPGHGVSPIDPSLILRTREWFDDIADRHAEYMLAHSPWGLIRVYEAHGLTLYLK